MSWNCPRCGRADNQDNQNSCSCGYQKEDSFGQLEQEALKADRLSVHYTTLGVLPNASIDEIKERCKELVKQWHPDQFQDDPVKHAKASARMQEFKKAYEAIIAARNAPNPEQPPQPKTTFATPPPPQPPPIPESVNRGNLGLFKKINPHIYCFGFCGGILSLILGVMLFSSSAFLGGLLILFGGIGPLVAGIYGLMGLSRCWSILQGTTAQTTPMKAVGFLFIPFFNLYWIFIAYAGLAKDANSFMEKQGLSKRINYNLAVAACVVSLIPYLNLLSFILFAILFYQIAAVNNEIIDRWDELSEHPAKSDSGMLVVIIVVAVLGFTAIIGILAAIAIPQYVTYRDKGADFAVKADSRKLGDKLDAYYQKNNSYPATLDELGPADAFKPSPNVNVNYKANCEPPDSSARPKCDDYEVRLSHNNSTKIYLSKKNRMLHSKQKTAADDSFSPVNSGTR